MRQIAQKQEGQFLAGFGKTDITPEESVPMASYGDDLRRFSEGKYSNLDARALAITDAKGVTMLFVVGDLSWCPSYLGEAIRQKIEEEMGIPQDHIVLSGTHTHSSVSPVHTHLPAIMRYRERYIAGMVEAARLALEDRKKAEIYIGSVITEDMNFVRRYIMDDGSLIGDNAYGTGTKIVSHETKADPKLQLMKFVRQGSKDILMGNFQNHPHLEGYSKNISAQVVGTFRDAVEERIGAHCIYWQGAAGNINTHSRIEGETRIKDRVEWGIEMCRYTQSVYDTMTRVEPGEIRVATRTYPARVNHMYDHITDKAEDVVAYFNAGHTPQQTAEYAWQYGINSYYHAARILANAKLAATKDMDLFAFSFGGVSGVVLPYEMFDTNGMYIKEHTPFDMTFIVGYSYPAYGGYLPSAKAWENGGYECDNCTFAPGTAEELAEQYLDLLKQLHS